MRISSTALCLGLLAAPALAQPSLAQTGGAQTSGVQTGGVQTGGTQTRVAPASSGPAFAPSVQAAGGKAGMTDADHKLALQRVEQHITALHRKLGITPAEQPEWDAFASVMRDNAERMEATHAQQHADEGSLTAVQDMQNYAAMVHQHAGDVDRLVPAFEAVYNKMSPEQKKAADKTFASFQKSGAEGHGRHSS